MFTFKLPRFVFCALVITKLQCSVKNTVDTCESCLVLFWGNQDERQCSGYDIKLPMIKHRKAFVVTHFSSRDHVMHDNEDTSNVCVLIVKHKK